MISQSDKERVREATDIVRLIGESTRLTMRAPHDFWGTCPFHNEKTPSFHVRSDLGNWHCFGCGESGDVFTFVQKREHMDFNEALHYLAERAHIEISETRSAAKKGPTRLELFSVLREASEFYQQQLMRSPSADKARAYAHDRGLNAEVCRAYLIGYAPGGKQLYSHLKKKGYSDEVMLAADLVRASSRGLNDRFFSRLMFTICDDRGNVIGFGGRVLDDSKPKYLNSKDSAVWHKSKNLYGLNLANKHIRETASVIICEGYTDTIALHETGFKNAVAVLGTALTENHVQLLARYKPERIIMLLDGDAAGQRAQERAVAYVDKTEAQLLSVTLPDGLDPAEYLSQYGRGALEQELSQANALVDDVLNRKLYHLDLSSPGKRIKALDDVAQVLAPLKSSILIDGYATEISDYLGFPKDKVLNRVNGAQPLSTSSDNTWTEKRTGQPPQQKHMQKLSKAERLERHLVAYLAQDIGLAHAYEDELLHLDYASEQCRAIVWALLALPQDATQNQIMTTLDVLVGNAATFLAEAQERTMSDPRRRIEALLAALNYERTAAKIDSIKARLKHETNEDRVKEMLGEVSRLQSLLVKIGTRSG